MAANEYYRTQPTSYESSYQPYRHDDRPVASDGPLRSPVSSQFPRPYDPRQSQYSINSDQDYPAGGGGRQPASNDYYTDDIPLKSNAPPTAGRPDWMDADTHYPPPSPDGHTQAHAPLHDPTMDPKRQKKSSRFFKKKIPWVVYITSLVQVIVFIVELVRNSQLTGSPIQTKPNFNPMIGPSPYVLVNMGARFVPCMRTVKGIQDAGAELFMPCPWTTSADLTSKDNQCTLSELCGFGGVPNPKIGGSITETPAPNQWFRYIIPMFLHAGIIHIGFNLFAMLTIGSDMERVIGWWRFAIVYFASGIMGFVFGANFDSGGISTGSSGCLFGVLAVCLLDLLYKWKSKQRPVTELIVMIFTILISFVLGLLPGLDNFAHIGGFVTGLVLGICLLRSPDQLRERIGLASPPYTTMSGGLSPEDSPNGRKFVKQPLTFFGGRKPLWWVWWLIRAGALVGIIVAFIVLLNDFYKHRTNCSWCKYLSCLPVHDWCEMGEFKTTPVQSSPRALFM